MDKLAKLSAASRKVKKNVQVPHNMFAASNPSYNEFIKCIEAILNTREKLNKIRLDLAASKLTSAYVNSNPTQIEKKLRRLSSELHRVRAIIEFQAQIQIKLQDYNFQSASPLRLNHHRAVLELINVMPKMTAELKLNVQNLEWFIRYQPSTSVERISTAVTQTFTLLEYTTKRLRDFYNVLMQLHTMHSVRKTAKSDEEVLSNYDVNTVCEWKEQKKLNEQLLEPTFFVQFKKDKFSNWGY